VISLVAVFAFGVMVVASASAVEFLLAEWLFEGAAVTAELRVQVSAELELTNTKAFFGQGVTVLCSVNWDGAILSNGTFSDGEDLTNEALSLSAGQISGALTGAALTCLNILNCVEPLVWFVNLPWNTLLELMEDTASFFVDLITESSNEKPAGWHLECMGVGGISDECTASLFIGEIKNLAMGEEIVFSRAFNELSGIGMGTCTMGGANSSLIVGNGMITDTSMAGTISASSTG
jgi:hypothetical protein